MACKYLLVFLSIGKHHADFVLKLPKMFYFHFSNSKHLSWDRSKQSTTNLSEKKYLLKPFIIIYTSAILALSTVFCGVLRQQDDDNVIAMDAIADVNKLIMHQSDLFEIDERFEQPNDEELTEIPEGAQSGLLLKTEKTQWKDGLVNYYVSDEFSEYSFEIGVVQIQDTVM